MEIALEYQLTDDDFRRVRTLIRSKAGIDLNEGKRPMIYGRLTRLLRVRSLRTFKEYLDLLERGNDQREWQAFTNALTTNLTSFFREAHHFGRLAQHLAEHRNRQAPVDIWCAACSTGEEAYSIAITAAETFSSLSPRVRIVASDIDTNVLDTARAGVYSDQSLAEITSDRKTRFFSSAGPGMTRVRPELSKLIEFRQINLVAPVWPVQGPLDVIFCRNVMIYFDAITRKRLLERFAGLLRPDGLLFTGHAETLFQEASGFKSTGMTVYRLAERVT